MNVIKDDSFGDVGRDVDCCCQALSIYQSLNLTLSLRDRDRADTIITLYHHHHTTTTNFLSTLELTYTQV